MSQSRSFASVAVVLCAAVAAVAYAQQGGVDPRLPNAPDQKPAVAGQTRAPERKTNVAFDVVTVAQGLEAPCSEAVVAQLARLANDGMSAFHIALLLGVAADGAEARTSQAHAEFVWTGPEVPGASSRDTAVVVQELWRNAERDVLVSTFVVHDVATVFLPLAQPMDQAAELRSRIFLNVGRPPRDTALDAELLREFADGCRRAWPGQRLPEVYYDPRGLSPDPAVRATWHAKCVVVDDEMSFVTSANFTEWAQQRNAEAGALVQARLVLRVPGIS